ncbi:MAG: hypothetical protein JO036_16470 [Candidatus Eremiobacteraeota bacterium]|nr:hypothetical protein [Candidatus Eremiobacteraeota bacterium]
MGSTTATKGSFSVRAWAGDFKTLLAFNLDKGSTRGLAGFTIQCEPPGQAPYYLLNELQFENPGDHAQDAKEPPNSSINAPFRKFRWLHVPGSAHQGLTPATGRYTYTATPRYFDAHGSLTPLDQTLSASVAIDVQPFEKGGLSLGFTRGFTQSQAFVNHFGKNALIQPKQHPLVFDTSQQSGKNAAGQTYTFADEYGWLGFTARTKIVDILTEVANDRSLSLEVFAYDLNEPAVIGALLELAKQRRVRVILDNASLHKSTAKKKSPEDLFEAAFRKAAGGKNAPILRGKFGRYSHDKVFIVSKGGNAVKVLTGSTNFSITGLYVNANHVLIFDDPGVAGEYAAVFEEAWKDGVKKPAFVKSRFAAQPFVAKSGSIPKTSITFAPHSDAEAKSVLGGIVKRIDQECKAGRGKGSVLFAVMAIDKGVSPVYTALKKLHADQAVFSFGISDNPGGIYLYKPGKSGGILTTGKPTSTMLPPPFSQVPNIGGVGHEIHHKFVVCGFNGADPVVYCGSSNLAQGGETNNGDNLLEIHDGDVAVVFAIEALGLVDHFNFLDAYARKKGGPKRPVADKRQAARDAHWYLDTNDKWVASYYDKNDLHNADRLLFA